MRKHLIAEYYFTCNKNKTTVTAVVTRSVYWVKLVVSQTEKKSIIEIIW